MFPTKLSVLRSRRLPVPSFGKSFAQSNVIAAEAFAYNPLCTLGHPEIFEIPLSKTSAAPKTAQQRKPQDRRAPAKMAIERDRWASML